MNPIELSQAALEGLEALKRGKPSNWEVPVYNADGDLLPRLGRFAAPASSSQSRDKSARKRKK
jgi:hypothetical protein